MVVKWKNQCGICEICSRRWRRLSHRHLPQRSSCVLHPAPWPRHALLQLASVSRHRRNSCTIWPDAFCQRDFVSVWSESRIGIELIELKICGMESHNELPFLLSIFCTLPFVPKCILFDFCLLLCFFFAFRCVRDDRFSVKLFLLTFWHPPKYTLNNIFLIAISVVSVVRCQRRHRSTGLTDCNRWANANSVTQSNWTTTISFHEWFLEILGTSSSEIVCHWLNGNRTPFTSCSLRIAAIDLSSPFKVLTLSISNIGRLDSAHVLWWQWHLHW